MNKYLKNFLIVFAIIVVVITPFFVYITVNRDELILVYMLYDHIQYNGNNYYRAGERHDDISVENKEIEPLNNKSYEQEPVYKESGERGPVYLVNKYSKVISKQTYNAYVIAGYEGDENEILLYFDSTMWIRDGFATTKTVETDD